MNFPRPTLNTQRLVLRPFEMSDAPAVQRLAGTKEVARTTAKVPHPYLDGMAESWIGTHQRSWTLGEAAQFAITLKETGELVGNISLVISKGHRRAELGYWIGAEFWNRGFATEAAGAVIEFGFKRLNLNKIAARHLDINAASGRVMVKNGMTQEGHLKQEFLKDGKFHGMVVYGLTVQEWEQGASSAPLLPD